MKSERRHELQQNTLAHWMIRGPEWLKENASRILLGVLLIVVLVVFYRRHQSSVRATAAVAEQQLNDARTLIDKMKGQLSSFNTGEGLSPDNARDAKTFARHVIDDGPTPQLKARGYIALGDYNLSLAQYPPGPGSENIDRVQSFKDAEDAYNVVLNQFKEQQMEGVAAHFGLATIEEDRGFAEIQAAKNPATLPADSANHWANARQHLEAVANDDKALTVLRDQAKKQLEELPGLQRRVMIAAATTRPALSGLVIPDGVATTGPTTVAATAPSATSTTATTTAVATTLPTAKLPATAPATTRSVAP